MFRLTTLSSAAIIHGKGGCKQRMQDTTYCVWGGGRSDILSPQAVAGGGEKARNPPPAPKNDNAKNQPPPPTKGVEQTALNFVFSVDLPRGAGGEGQTALNTEFSERSTAAGARPHKTAPLKLGRAPDAGRSGDLRNGRLGGGGDLHAQC